MALVADYGMDSDQSDEEMDTNQEAPSVQLKSNTDGTNDVLEDFVKKINYGDTPLEKPPPKSMMSGSLAQFRLPSAKGAKGKIKISIPTLQDADSEEDEPKPKKNKVSTGASGFLGSLPAPRGGGKESGRVFVPYTLTKNKPAANAKSLTIKKSVSKTVTTKVSNLTTAYSDSDEDESGNPQSTMSSGNFFSLDPDPEAVIAPQNNTIGTSHALFNVQTTNSYVEEVPQPRLTAASLYNMTDHTEEYTDTYDTGNVAEGSSSNGNDVNKLLNDEQFLRMQGKKHRGKEVIEFIDIHTDDQKTSEIELTKNISEEVDPAAFAHRKKGEGPSSQQKRKHQITYLAFQAKERELELKNTWAANKATKQKTQAKYGF